MKKIYLYLLLLVCLGCKKSADTPAPATTTTNPVVTTPAMNIKFTSDQPASYLITEEDPVSGDFYTKDDYGVTSLDYTFKPAAGHNVIIEIQTTSSATITASATYNSKVVGPLVAVKGTDNTTINYTYVVPK